MPPEFPGERQKRRETPRPKESLSVDDLAKDIKRDYRESQVKVLKDEKSVRQPSEGNLSPEAPAESMSEAIGNKFREKEGNETQKSKQSTPTDSRKTTPSVGERTTLEKRDQNDERKPLKSYEVKMYTPTIRGVEIKTENALREYANSELSGMKHLSNYDKIFGDALAHIRLTELVGERHELKLSDIRSLSEQTNLPFRTTRNHVANEGRPDFYRLAEKAITKSEAKSIIDDIHSKLGALRSHADVERNLGEKGTLEHLRSLPSYQQDNAMVHKYFKFIDTLSEGGVMRDIARRAGVGECTCISWAKGVLPLHVKKAIGISESSIIRKPPSVEEGLHESIKDARPVSRFKMTVPEIKGVPIESDAQLKSIIAKEYRGMMDMAGFDKMLHEACAHQQIMNRFRGREYLEYGEIRSIAAEFNMKAGTVEVWTNKGIAPRLYFHINRSISSSEALEQLKTISKRNNGVITYAEYERRMQNYYLRRQEQNASFDERESAITKQYFRFLERYQPGGPLAHAARQAGVAPSTGLGWLNGSQPRRVRIASGIPKEEPKPGHLWLPLRFRDGRYPEDFIHVPETVKSYKDVLSVVKQLKPIENERMIQLQTRLGRRSIEEEFMYLLGAYISDAGIFNETTIGQSLGIRLATKYTWSPDFGEGFCQSLQMCGIHAHRNENTPARITYKRTEERIWKINQSEKLNWASENSPLVKWIHESCLGFNNRAPKREQQMSADWILTAPRLLRVSFVQGWSDGDGCVSPRGRYFCLTTSKNQKFASDLMSSFGIDMRVNGPDVFTRGYENAIRAAEIPMFRYASGREEASRKMVRMIDSTRSVKKNPLTNDELEYMVRLRKRGLSWFDIHETMFDHFGTAIHRTTIENAVRRYSSGDPLHPTETKKENE